MSHYDAFSAPSGPAISQKNKGNVSSGDNMPTYTDRGIDLSTLCSAFVYPPLLPPGASTPELYAGSSSRGSESPSELYPEPLYLGDNKVPLSFDQLEFLPLDLSLVPFQQPSQYDIACMMAYLESLGTPTNKACDNAAACKTVSAQTVTVVEEDEAIRTPRASARLAGNKSTRRPGGSTEDSIVFACRRASCSKTFSIKNSRDRHERARHGTM